MKLRLGAAFRKWSSYEPGASADALHNAGLSAVASRPSSPQATAEGFAGWLMRCLAQRRGDQVPRRMVVLETLSLGPRRQLALVECEGRRFLVGGGADNVATIVPVDLPTSAAVPSTHAEGSLNPAKRPVKEQGVRTAATNGASVRKDKIRSNKGKVRKNSVGFAAVDASAAADGLNGLPVVATQMVAKGRPQQPIRAAARRAAKTKAAEAAVGKAKPAMTKAAKAKAAKASAGRTAKATGTFGAKPGLETDVQAAVQPDNPRSPAQVAEEILQALRGMQVDRSGLPSSDLTRAVRGQFDIEKFEAADVARQGPTKASNGRSVEGWA